MKPIFLSSSIPDPKRNEKYFGTADILAIRESVTALTITVTPHTQLIFGGHPAISPLIYSAAKRIGTLDNVIIYQSKFFEEFIPKESLSFDRICWTPSTGDRASSLDLMRAEMLWGYNYGAGIAIGGMEGVDEEYEIFRGMHPRTKMFPISSTGAAAKFLLEKQDLGLSRKTKDLLSREYSYSWLFRKLLKIKI